MKTPNKTQFNFLHIFDVENETCILCGKRVQEWTPKEKCPKRKVNKMNVYEQL